MSEVNQKASIGKDAVILTTSRVIVALIGLITSMLLARFRTLDEYGTYSQIIMIMDLMALGLWKNTLRMIVMNTITLYKWDYHLYII